MQWRALGMRTTAGLPRWFWVCVCGIGLISVGIGLIHFLKPNDSHPSPSQAANFSDEIEPNELTIQPKHAKPLVAEIKADSTSTPLTFPVGSVEEACGLHELPPYEDWDRYRENSKNEDLLTPLLASEDCKTALEKHVGALNPYIWEHISTHLQFALFEIDKPLTFERIFADPLGDFARLQDAMSRTECLLEKGTTINFELKESCNADALMNYALFNRFCYYWSDVINPSGRRMHRLGHSPEQSSSMWKKSLKERWVKQKCQEFDPDLRLSTDKYPDLTQLLSSFEDSQSLGIHLIRAARRRHPELTDPEEPLPPISQISNLIELAARLGDDAAALTRMKFHEQGMRLGRFRGLLSNPAWTNLQTKREPSQERLRQTFELLSTIASSNFELNWEQLVRHLCEPPFTKSNRRTSHSDTDELEESTEPQSCRAVINELYIDGDLTDSELHLIDQFERSALKLDLYR